MFFKEKVRHSSDVLFVLLYTFIQNYDLCIIKNNFKLLVYVVIAHCKYANQRHCNFNFEHSDQIILIMCMQMKFMTYQKTSLSKEGKE